MDAIRDAVVHRYYLDAFERVIYTESHDEVANGKARVSEEVNPGKASSWAAKKKSCLGAAMVFTSPGIPMIFQGQEFLEDDWFHDQDPLDWSKKMKYSGIFRLYQDLIALRLNRQGYTLGLSGQEVNVYHINQDKKIIVYHRWDKGGPGDSVVVVANFSVKSQTDYLIGFPEEGEWIVRFNSDSKLYDREFGDVGVPMVWAVAHGQDGLPAGGTLDIAPYSVIIMSQEKKIR
jgi:1,4-alpha-glucan branching enzyme